MRGLVESKQERKLRIWRNLTPEQRDYDRFVARQIPQGATWGAETKAGLLWQNERDRLIDEGGEHEGCSCHISAPCSFCINQPEDDQ